MCLSLSPKSTRLFTQYIVLEGLPRDTKWRSKSKIARRQRSCYRRFHLAQRLESSQVVGSGLEIFNRWILFVVETLRVKDRGIQDRLWWATILKRNWECAVFRRNYKFLGLLFPAFSIYTYTIKVFPVNRYHCSNYVYGLVHHHFVMARNSIQVYVGMETRITVYKLQCKANSSWDI